MNTGTSEMQDSETEYERLDAAEFKRGYDSYGPGGPGSNIPPPDNGCSESFREGWNRAESEDWDKNHS